jgi:hypothetical protein
MPAAVYRQVAICAACADPPKAENWAWVKPALASASVIGKTLLELSVVAAVTMCIGFVAV